MESPGWIQNLQKYLIIQAIFGLVAVEWAFYKTRRYRENAKKHVDKYLQFRRLDVNQWTRPNFYIGAMFMLMTRLILLHSIFFIGVFGIIFVTSCHNFNKPIGPFTSRIIFAIWQLVASGMLLVCGVSFEYEEIDADYSFYLGPDYKEKQKHKPKPQLIVSNHVSMIDSAVMQRAFQPSFCPTSGLQSVPIFGKVLRCLQCIFIPRGQSEEQKEAAIKAIVDRINLNEADPRLPPLLLFPEGGTSTNIGLIRFKRGAFECEKSIKPAFMKWSYGQISPSFTLHLYPLLIMLLSSGPIQCKMNVMPDFHPTEYMFETHKRSLKHENDTENLRWETYAWAVRNAMINAGGFQNEPTTIREKLVYERYMAQFDKKISMDNEGNLIDNKIETSCFMSPQRIGDDNYTKTQ